MHAGNSLHACGEFPACEEFPARMPLHARNSLRACEEFPAFMLASGHTMTNTPDLFRTLKLTVIGPGQYWGGGPPGKSLGCC